MAPKRRAPGASSSATPKPRLTKLAKENNISNEQESEIREAFSLFAEKEREEFAEKEGVIRAEDVRRCLIALGVKIKKSELPEILETLDPADSGFVTYGHFLSFAALHLHHNNSDDDAEDQSEEVQEAYNLFTQNNAGPITLVHLRRIARLLKEEVSDDVLKDMLVEANGGGREGWKRGVGIEDFEGVMRRAGVFG